MHPGWEERKKTAATPVWESRSAANDALLRSVQPLVWSPGLSRMQQERGHSCLRDGKRPVYAAPARDGFQLAKQLIKG